MPRPATGTLLTTMAPTLTLTLTPHLAPLGFLSADRRVVEVPVDARLGVGIQSVRVRVRVRVMVRVRVLKGWGHGGEEGACRCRPWRRHPVC